MRRGRSLFKHLGLMLQDWGERMLKWWECGVVINTGVNQEGMDKRCLSQRLPSVYVQWSLGIWGGKGEDVAKRRKEAEKEVGGWRPREWSGWSGQIHWPNSQQRATGLSRGSAAGLCLWVRNQRAAEGYEGKEGAEEALSDWTPEETQAGANLIWARSKWGGKACPTGCADTYFRAFCSSSSHSRVWYSHKHIDIWIYKCM